MTHMAIILATPQQALPEGQPVGNGQNQLSPGNEFAPHLENAIAEVTETNFLIPANLTIPVATPQNTEANLFTNIPPHFIDLAGVSLFEASNNIEAAAAVTRQTGLVDVTLEAATAAAVTKQTGLVDVTLEAATAAAVTKQTGLVDVALEATTKPGVLDTAFAALNKQSVINATSFAASQPGTTEKHLSYQKENTTEHPRHELQESIRGGWKTNFLTPQSLERNSTTSLNINVSVSVNGTQLPPSQPANFTENNAILQQLHTIIHNSNETGKVSIEGTVNKYTVQSAGEIEPKISGFVFNQPHESEKISDKPGLKTSPLRQDINGQYLEAKMNAREQNNSSSNNENNSQTSGANSEQVSTPPPLNPSLAQEQASSYQQISTLVQDAQNSHAQNMSKPVTLPSGTVVYEEDVIQQLIERFQIFRKPNDTRLSLKLHPAELGELRIDLTVKEGSVKAHVIAQSQHVQEMVERNMSKLRNVLEEQGFTIEELLVTSESDSVTDFNLFEQHLSHGNDYTPPTVETKDRNGFNSILEDAVEDVVVTPTGVNIKV